MFTVPDWQNLVRQSKTAGERNPSANQMASDLVDCSQPNSDHSRWQMVYRFAATFVAFIQGRAIGRALAHMLKGSSRSHHKDSHASLAR